VTERELTRNAARRLAIIRHAQEVNGNVAQSCRYFGITRQAYYTWLHRHEELGPDGLRDRSHRPLVSPNATKAAVIDRIVYLRQNYHFGPQKISMYLKRYHEITISQSGVWRILRRLDLSRLPTSQRYKRHKERWFAVPGCGFDQLRPNPGGGGLGGDLEVDQLAPPMADEEEDVHRLEGQGLDNQEVGGPDPLSVVGEKGEPTLAGRGRMAGSPVAPDRAGADGNAEL